MSLLAGVLAATVLTIQPDSTQPVALSCPLDRPTRIVLPEALRRLRAPGQNAALDVTVERTQPEGVLVVTPRAHPLRTAIEVRGATRDLHLVVESTASGESGDIQIEFLPRRESAAPPTAPPVAEATEAPAAATSPPASAPPAAAEGLDTLELLKAKVVVVGEREGLPGQAPMVLTDALQGESWVWLRFLLSGGAASQVTRVSWEGGAIESFSQEALDKDLRVIVRLSRAALTRRAHVTLEIDRDATYTFAMGSRSLRELLR
jgi:hypothetical protein